MTLSRSLLAVVVVLFTAVSLLGESRTWTDKQGRQIEAEFVRVFNGTVIFKQGTRVVRVPLNNLSDSDQQFIQNGGKEVPEEPIVDEPARLDRPASAEKRTWTDRKGSQLEATFVRMHDRNVVLNVGGRISSFSFNDFSDTDQIYVRDWLRSQGEDEQAAQIDQLMSTQRDAVESSPSPSNPASEAMRRLEENRRRIEEQQRQTMAKMEEERRQRREQQERELQKTEQQRREERERREEEERQRREEERQRREDDERQREEAYANSPHAAPPSPSVPSNNYPSGPSYDGYGDDYEIVCMSCNKVVPASSQAGDSCPHCGVYWDYYEDENGRKDWAEGSGGVRVGGLVALVCFVITAIAGFVRRLSG